MKQITDNTEIINGYELFCDVSNFDMWAVRIQGERDFYRTLHFVKKQDALDVIAFATETKKQLLNEIKSKFQNDPYWVYKGLLEFVDKKLFLLK